MCFFCAGPTFGVPLAHQMYIGYEEFVIPPILHNTTTYLLSYLHVEGKLISVFVGGFFFFFFSHIAHQIFKVCSAFLGRKMRSLSGYGKAKRTKL
jgi:hypothetical protein